jgi:outer membrane biosynthesis protein TonB
MISLDQIDSKELKVAVTQINETALVEKMRTVGVSKADQIKKFTEAFDTLQQTNLAVLQEKCKDAILFYNKIYADEVEGGGTTEETKEEPVVEEKKEEKPAKEKKEKKEKVEKPAKEPKSVKEKVEKVKEERVSRKGQTPDQITETAGKRYELMSKLVGEGKYTKKEIVELVRKEFPAISSITIVTNLTDSKNPKYNKLSKLASEVEKDGKKIFVFA